MRIFAAAVDFIREFEVKFANQWSKFTLVVNSNELFYEHRERNHIRDYSIERIHRPDNSFDELALCLIISYTSNQS